MSEKDGVAADERAACGCGTTDEAAAACCPAEAPARADARPC